MTERPIIFSGPMVRAILDGRKTQTRRAIKLPEDVTEGPRYWTTPTGRPQAGYANPGVNYWTPSGNHIDPCPYGFPGDMLWVRETFANMEYECNPPAYTYRADTPSTATPGWALPPGVKWKPSIHMPRAAARLFLRVTDVRVERLQDIDESDAWREGVEPARAGQGDSGPIKTHRTGFVRLWNKLNEQRGYGWLMNPWVWVVSFDVLTSEDTE